MSPTILQGPTFDRECRSLLVLHEGLIRGNHEAFDAIVNRVFHRLVDAAERRFRGTAGRQLVADGVVDALMEYRQRPERFDPERGVPLERFLALAAARNVTDSLRKLTRRKAKEERASAAGKKFVELDTPAANLLSEEERTARPHIDVLSASLPSPADRRILRAMAAGVRATRVYAAILGVSDRPPDARRRLVKRAKDRIVKHLQRKFQRPKQEDHP